ncbi:hypothetical protein Ciccas_000137 [Cichlidogyrus casuarinus]|uniref:Uncharacterized protein n=1 Tax=Cichlidogyrus casuarinus TaxID=1844966 RepID=A0ABD2QNT4_9PLAT
MIRADQDDLKIFVLCPLMTSKICFQDCLISSKCSDFDAKERVQENCIPEADSTNCQMQTFNNGSKLVSVKLDQTDSRLGGSWSCTYKGMQSREISIHYTEVIKLVQVTTVTPQSTPSTTVTMTTTTTTQKPVQILNEEMTSTANLVQAEVSIRHDPGKEDVKVAKSSYFSVLMEPEIVLVVVIFLLISLLLNIICCARCFMVRNYLSSKSRKPPKECLNSALCIPSGNGLYEDENPGATLLSANQATNNSGVCMPLLPTVSERGGAAYVIASTRPLINTYSPSMRVLHEPFYATPLAKNRTLSNQVQMARTADIYGTLHNQYPIAHIPEVGVNNFRQASIYDEVASTTNTVHSSSRPFQFERHFDSYAEERAIDPVEDQYPISADFITNSAANTSSMFNRSNSSHEVYIGPSFDVSNRCKTPMNMDMRISAASAENEEQSFAARKLLDEAGNLLERAEMVMKD